MKKSKKTYTCEHEAKNELRAGCVYCEFAVANKRIEYLEKVDKELKETLRQFIAIIESEIYGIGNKLMARAKEITEYEKN